MDTIEQNARQLIVLNEKLAASEKLLTELNSNKDRFFSIISHDLRNPFMGILGYSKMLAEESLDSETKRYLLNFMKPQKIHIPCWKIYWNGHLHNEMNLS